MSARQRVERSRVHGDYHGASPLLYRLGIAPHRPALQAHRCASPAIRPAAPRGASPGHSARRAFWERALFLIFAAQQMIANRARLAFAHDFPIQQARALRTDRAHRPTPHTARRRAPPTRRRVPAHVRAPACRRTADRERRHRTNAGRRLAARRSASASRISMLLAANRAPDSPSVARPRGRCARPSAPAPRRATLASKPSAPLPAKRSGSAGRSVAGRAS